MSPLLGRCLMGTIEKDSQVKTRSFRGPGGDVLPRSIAEAGYVRLGGIDQWVMTRGADSTNPLLMMLHGGPGFTDTPFFRTFNAALEKHFTVVYWDQRGAGKSFDGNIPESSMTVERFIADLDELIDRTCERLHTEKTVIFGHSWGTALGILYAARFPERVAAYVGSGQIGDWQRGEALSYEFALAEAERLRDHKTLEKLRGIGPPPYPASSLWTQRFALNRLEGALRPRALSKAALTFLRAPEFSIFDVPKLMRGFRFSIDAMWDEVSKINLIESVPMLEMPVFFFIGRRDHWVPAQASKEYFDVLLAPSKSFVWFDESGHEPFVDEPAKFNASMVDLVRPIVA